MGNLADYLRSKSVNVEEVKGWQTHARPYTFAPVGVMIHHTAGTNSLKIVRNGRTGLPGPLSQFLIAKSGKVYLISQGYCNHAGYGMASVLADLKSEKAPQGDATARGNVTGNRYFWGIEVENLGNGSDPYPDVQIRALETLCAALLERHGWSAARIVHHREWTRRKIDMSWRGDVRGNVDRILRGEAPRNYTVDCSGGVFESGDRGDCVKQIQVLLRGHGHSLETDGVFGPLTETEVKAFQNNKALTVDGIVGPNTWRALRAEQVVKPAPSEYPMLKAGSIHNAVNTVRALLNKLGYRVASAGTLFDSKVDTAVREFQREQELVVDGIVGPNTWGELKRAVEAQPSGTNCSSNVFRSGDSGDCVSVIQTRLNDKGFETTVDGDFGPKTEAAVRRFQTVFRVTADGIVGPETWNTFSKDYDLDRAFVYKSGFERGLAALLSIKWNVPIVSAVSKRIVRRGIVVGDAADFQDQYAETRVIRGATSEATAELVYRELVHDETARG